MVYRFSVKNVKLGLVTIICFHCYRDTYVPGLSKCDEECSVVCDTSISDLDTLSREHGLKVKLGEIGHEDRRRISQKSQIFG